jgi:hypothetical protein
MGAHRSNPGAAGFAGPMPDAMLSGNCQVTVEPSEEWKAKNIPIIEAAKAEGPEAEAALKGTLVLKDVDRVVVVKSAVAYIIPSRILPQKDWPTIYIDAGETRIPLLEMKQGVKESLAKDHPALAEFVKIEEERELLS